MFQNARLLVGGVCLVLSTLGGFGARDAAAAIKTWDGGGVGSAWATVANWSGDTVPAATDDVLFGSAFTSGTSITLAANTSVNSVTIDTATSFGISGSRLDITSGNITRTTASSGTQTDSSQMRLGASGTWAINGSGALQMTAIISQAFGITKSGTGLLILSGANTFSGGLIINDGTVRGTTSTGALGAGTLTLGGGNLELANDTALNYARNTTVSTSGTIFSERLTAGGGVTHTLGTLSIGAQTLTLATDSSVTSGTAGLTFGAVTLSADGATFNASAGTLLTLAGVSGNTFGFTVGGAGDTTISAAIATTTGGLTKIGAGKLTLSASNSFSGTASYSAGTLELGNSAALFNSTLDVGTGAVGALSFGGLSTVSVGGLTGTNGLALVNASSAAINLSIGGASQTSSYSGVLSGIGSLTKVGTGNLTLTGLNTYTGTTAIVSGTLTADSIVVASGASNLGNASTAVTLGDATNRGTLAYAGSSTTYTRGFTVNAGGGQLDVTTAGQTLTIATGNVTGSGTFTVGGDGDVNVTSTISSVGLTKAGEGTLTLSAATTSSGTTTVSSGTLRYAVTGAIGSGPVRVTGGTLDLDTYSDTVGTVTITGGSIIGSGTLTSTANFATTSGTISAVLAGTGFGVAQAASGTTVLAGANTFTGASTIAAGGVLQVQNDAALGSTAAGVTVSDGGALWLSGDIAVGAEALSVRGVGTDGNGGLKNVSGTNSYAGTITLSNVLTIGSDAGLLTLSGTIVGGNRALTLVGNGDLTFSGSVGAIASMTKNGTGRVTISNGNANPGATTINAGVVRAANDLALGTTAGATTVAVGAALELDGGISIGAEGLTLNGTGVAGNGALRNVSGTNTYGGAITFASAATIAADADTRLNLTNTLGGNFLKTFQGAGVISAGGVISGVAGLTMAGPGSLTLSAANSFSGTTTIQSGTISVGSVAVGATNQPLGTNARLDLGVANTSSGRLVYTGGSGTLSKNVFALGNGTDTIQNAGSGLLTLSGTLTKNATVLRLQGGAQGIRVTGTIVGASANSDLAVQNGLTTLSATNTYTGPTFINSSGTLALGVSNAIPSNSAVTIGGTFAGGDGGAGVLSMGSFTNAIGGLAFAGSGGTIAMAPTASATSTVVLSATGAVVLNGASSTLDLTGMTTGASLYRLVGGSSLTGTFASVTGLNSNYLLRYGTVNANEVDAQLKANQATTFTMTTGAVTRALVNTNVAVSGTITNSQSQTGASSLALDLTSTGLTGSGFTTGSVAPGANLAVSGTLNAGATAGTQNWTITNTDPNAITTTSTATGSLQVVNQRTFSVSPTTVALGRYLITSAVPTGTTAVTSLGLSATTANASLGSFSSSNGYTLSLTSGSANFAGAAASQTAGYTLTGSAASAGLLSGSFSSTVTAELGSIDPVVVNYTANPVNQRVFTTSTSTLALGFVHQGGSFTSPTLTVTSTGLNATTADATLGSFTGGPSGFTLDLTSGSAAFLGASGTQSTVYTLSGPTSTPMSLSGTFSSSVTAELGSIPNVTVAVTGGIYSGQSTWATNGGSSWGTLSGTGAGAFGTNWGVNQGSPGLDAGYTTTDTATFGPALTSGTAVILLNGAGPSLAGITFNNAAGTYDLDVGTGGTGRITLAAGGTSAATIDVLAGSHEIHTELQFGSNLDVSVAAASALTLHGAISGSTFSLTKTGAGLLTVRGNNSYSGGTLISGGTLAIGNAVSPLGSGTVVVINNATLDLRGFTIGNSIDATYGVILNPSAANIDITGTVTVSSTGSITGLYTVQPNASGTFTAPLGIPAGLGGTIVVQGGGSIVSTSTITSNGSVLVNTGAQATLSGPVNGSVTTAGATTFAAGLDTLADVTVSGGTATFAGTTLGDVNVDVSGTNTGAATAIFTGTIAKTAHAYASGTITILGDVAATADVKTEAGGVVQLMGSGSFGQSAMTNNGLFSVDRTTSLTLATAISGSGSLQKAGTGVLELTGASTFTGPTSLDGGSLLVNGSLASGVASLAGTTLGGSGTIGGMLSGAGLVSPGNSPGILTASVFDPTGSLDAAFEFTAFSPNYAVSGTGALNDVLRLTGTSPFGGSALTGGNVIDIYFDIASLAYNDRFQGGFFSTQSPEQLLASVQTGTFQFWFRTAGAGQRTFNGVNYDPLNYSYSAFSGARVETRQVTVNFGEGNVTGSVTEFVAVPEPSAIVLAGLGLVALGAHSRLRRLRRAVRPS